MNVRSIFTDQRGLSLTEVIVSVGVVATSTLAFVTIFSSSQKMSKLGTHQSSCQAYVEDAINKIQGMGSANVVEPIDDAFWTLIPASDNLRKHSGNVTTGGDTETGIKRLERWDDDDDHDIEHRDPTDNFVYLRNSHLIHGPVNGMLTIYNSDPTAYCGSGNWANYNYTPASISDKLFPVNADGVLDSYKMYNVNAMINITPYSRTTRTNTDPSGAAIGCPARLVIVPRGQRWSGVDSPTQYWAKEDVSNSPVTAGSNKEVWVEGGTTPTAGGSTYIIGGGLQVLIRVAYDDPEGNAHECTGKLYVEYPDDPVNTTPAIDYVVDDASELFGLDITPHPANPPATYSCGVDEFDVSVRVGYDESSVEAGSVLLCRNRSWQISESNAELETVNCIGGAPVRVAKQFYHIAAFWQPDENGFAGPETEPNGGPLGPFPGQGYQLPKEAYTEISGNASAYGTYGTPLATNFFDTATPQYPNVTDQPWEPCQDIEICGAPVTGTTREVNGTRKIWKLDFDDVPAGCTINVDMAMVDPAGNMTVQHMRDNTGTVLDPNQPWVAQNFQSWNQTLPFNTCGTYCGIHSVTGNGYFQCGGCP